jgi:predicted kinase
MIIMCKGLPASGKSTWARETAKNSGGKIVRINKDDLRMMLNDGKYSREREKNIVETRNALTCIYLAKGKSVIIDDTNFAPEHEAVLRGIAESFEVGFEIKYFDTPLGVCLERNRARERKVPEDFILETWMKYVKPVPLDSVDGTKAIICDLDGTLALMNGRSPYNASTCENDLVNPLALHIYRSFPNEVYRIIMSGRDGKYREETKRWLQKHDIRCDHLLMRKEGDTTKDEIIKRQLYHDYVEGKYDVLAVIDDRPKVCRMWQYDLGLPLVNLGYNIEF